MSITSELCGEIRERCEGRPPRQYAILPHGFRLETIGGNGVKLYRTDRPDIMAEIATTGRDGAGYRWFTRAGWREEVKALVLALGMDIQETSEEVPF